MVLTQANFTSYALDNYQFVAGSSREEFVRDVNVLSRINRCLKEAVDEKDTTNLLLMINCVVIVFNVFGTIAATRLLAFKVDKKLHRQLKALLIATGRYVGSEEFKKLTPCVRFYRLIEGNLASR